MSVSVLNPWSAQNGEVFEIASEGACARGQVALEIRNRSFINGFGVTIENRNFPVWCFCNDAVAISDALYFERIRRNRNAMLACNQAGLN